MMTTFLSEVVEPDLLMECKFREITERVTNWPNEDDRSATCDKCGKHMMFSEGVIYYFNGVPELVCPECAEEKDKEDFEGKEGEDV